MWRKKTEKKKTEVKTTEVIRVGSMAFLSFFLFSENGWIVSHLLSQLWWRMGIMQQMLTGSHCEWIYHDITIFSQSSHNSLSFFFSELCLTANLPEWASLCQAARLCWISILKPVNIDLSEFGNSWLFYYFDFNFLHNRRLTAGCLARDIHHNTLHRSSEKKKKTNKQNKIT